MSRSRRVCFVASDNGVFENPSQVERLRSSERSQADDGGGDGSSTSRREGRHQADSNSVTLFNVNMQYVNIELNWFSRQTSVRVLQLGRWQNSATHHIEVDNTKFLEGPGAQKHLQYLSLRGLSRITKLPADSIHKLTTLKILDLRACHNLEELPSGIKAMRMLTHLDVSECYLLEQMPRGFDALSHLQVLKGFVMCNSKCKNACRLKDLAKLEKLRKLSIIVGRDAEIAQDDFAHFEKLHILTITWGATAFSGDRPAPTSMPLNLEKLDLRCFPKKDSPTWLRPRLLMNLKRLYIRGGKLDGLSNIGETESWKVEILRLKFLKDFKMEWASLRKDFPSLSYLEQKECVQLTSFQCDKQGVWVKN